ncbi:uncharacterized protein LOC134857250 isoform X3 [Symsagittifera roscoffensis]|uniref:uncharacterized protein LOC134857250 isoform X3 n=1 Tax=Symsagittifera roscoffensis TaxID=84072 RepID=UPI00307CA95E
MAASEVVLSKTEINSSQKSESETFENSGVMSRESTNPGKQSEPMGHSEQSDNLKVGFEPTIKQTKDGQGEKQKRKNRALRKFESVDDFEEAEMEEKVIPLSWEQLKKCDLLDTEDKTEADMSGVDPPFLQVQQKEEGLVRVHWVNKPLNNQKQLISRKLSRFDGTSSSSAQQHTAVKPDDVILRLTEYELYVTGTYFAPDCDSERSASTFDDSGKIQIYQHLWTFPGEDNTATLTCLNSGDKYKFRVVAIYEVSANGMVFNERVRSVNKFFITIGRPSKPDIRISDLDPLQVMLTWSLIETHPKVAIGGYLVSLDGGVRTLQVGPDVRFPFLGNLTPNSLHEVRVKVLSSHSSGDSDFSDPILVRVPERPETPKLELMPIEDVGKVQIRWTVGSCEQKTERVNWCSIFLGLGNNKAFLFHKVAVTNSQEDMFYTFQDLNLGEHYRCYVQTHVGTNEVSKTGSFGVCEIISEESNSVKFSPCAPPIPGTLTIKCLYEGGFQMQWEDPIEFGDAKVMGYQLIKDGEPHGPVLSPESRTGCIDEAVPGSFYRVQLVALCDHLICKKPFVIEGYTTSQYFMKIASGSKLETAEQRKLQSLFAQTKKIRQSTQAIQGYEGCLPGYSIVVPYRGLVHGPSNIVVKDIQGSSATVQWSLWSVGSSRPKWTKLLKSVHFKKASHYRVYWWYEGDEEAYETDTEHNEVSLQFLKPNARYNLAVEARREEENEFGNLLVKSVSDVIAFSTGAPPEKPRDPRVVGRTSDSVTIGWTQPLVDGYQLYGYRIEVREQFFETEADQDPPDTETKCFNIPPTETQFTVPDLAHTTQWDFTLMVISDRYFEACQDKKMKNLTEIPLEMRFEKIVNHWLPYVTLSSLTLPKEDIRSLVISKLKPNSITLKWATFTSPNDDSVELKYEKQVVSFNEYSENVGGQSTRYFDCVSVDPEARRFTLSDLEPATVYQINLEATSKLPPENQKGKKLSKKSAQNPDQEEEFDSVHVYDPLIIRTPAPIKSSNLVLTGYTPTSIRVSWAKPCTHRNPDNVFATKIIRRDLKEYRVVINGKTNQPVDVNQQLAVLTKCQPGKTYHLVLATITSTYHLYKDPEMQSTFGRSKDFAYSLPVSITLPDVQKGKQIIQAFDCEFVRQCAEGKNEEGYIRARWVIYKGGLTKGGNNNQASTKTNAEMGIDSFEVVWESDTDSDEVYSVTVACHDSWVLIPVDRAGSVYRILLIVSFNDGQEPQRSEMLTYQVPSQPPKPLVHIHHVSRLFFIIEWMHEGASGPNQTRGFQTYIDGRRAGNMLEPGFFKAKIASKIDQEYNIQVQASSSHPDMPHSELSDPLIVRTDMATMELYKQMYIDMHGLANVELNFGSSDRLPGTGGERGEVKLGLLELTDTVMAFRIMDLNSENVSNVKVEWNSFDSAETRQLLLPPDQKDISLSTFGPGIHHFIRFFGVEEHGFVVTKSKQITVLSAKKLEQPVLRPKKVSFEELVVSWSSLRDLRDLIIGYRVIINGKEITEVENYETEYVFTLGQMCREYKFEVQALANHEYLDSEVSKPLVILWPGIITPDIYEVMTTTGNAIKIAWSRPFSSKNVKILGYWVYCKMRQDQAEDVNKTEKRMIVGPLEADTTSYQLENLSTVCLYQIYIELKIAGLDQFLQSNKLTLRPVHFPHAPVIKTNLVGVNERPQLEMEMCRLIRSWWSLLGFDGSASFKQGSERQQEINDLYKKMEPMLAKIAQFTGKIEGEITWEKLDQETREQIAGFKVIVNGSQVGAILPSTQNKFNFKLSMGKPEYTICVGSVVQDSSFPLQKSNKVTVDSTLFRPFSLFCYSHVHSRVARWPNRGCCAVADMLAEELQQQSNSKLKRQQASSLPGLIRGERKRWPNPYVYDVLNKCETSLHLLFDDPTLDDSSAVGGGGPGGARRKKSERSGFTVVLFYTNWCLSSQKTFRHVTRWASTNDMSTKLITCCVGSGEQPDVHYANVAKLVKDKNESDSKNWLADNIQHVCGCFSLSGGVIDLSRPDTQKNSEKKSVAATPASNASSKRIQEMFNLIGVPTISIVYDQSSSIVWQGRPLASTQEEFAQFFTEVIHSLPRSY